ncbi:MAG: radical SAM protein, partial [Zoogloea sp.]|nr:radical SAM protein [Zoogloea sp.]
MPEGLRNLYLLVSGDCNLACSYCYADGGSFGGEAARMSAATMEAALAALLRADAEVTISFFGGEPLLNLQLMQHTVARGTAIAAARNTRLHFVLTTNGTLLDDERLAFLKAHIRHVAVSLDGAAALTDRNRRFRSGNDSVHRRVSANLQRLREAGIAYGLRGTIPEDAVDALE